MFLRILQVEQEDGIEHLQDFLLVDMVRMQIVTDFQHLIRQSQGIVVLQRHLGLMQL